MGNHLHFYQLYRLNTSSRGQSMCSSETAFK